MIYRPTVRLNEFAVYAWEASLDEKLVGKDVEIRDWYGDVRARVTGVLTGLTGYPCTLSLRLQDGKEAQLSLHTVREIEEL